MVVSSSALERSGRPLHSLSFGKFILCGKMCARLTAFSASGEPGEFGALQSFWNLFGAHLAAYLSTSFGANIHRSDSHRAAYYDYRELDLRVEVFERLPRREPATLISRRGSPGVEQFKQFQTVRCRYQVGTIRLVISGLYYRSALYTLLG